MLSRGNFVCMPGPCCSLIKRLAKEGQLFVCLAGHPKLATHTRLQNPTRCTHKAVAGFFPTRCFTPLHSVEASLGPWLPLPPSSQRPQPRSQHLLQQLHTLVWRLQGGPGRPHQLGPWLARQLRSQPMLQLCTQGCQLHKRWLRLSPWITSSWSSSSLLLLQHLYTQDCHKHEGQPQSRSRRITTLHKSRQMQLLQQRDVQEYRQREGWRHLQCSR